MTVASGKMDGCRHQEKECVCVCTRQRNPFKRCGGMVEGQWVKARIDDWSQGLHEFYLLYFSLWTEYLFCMPLLAALSRESHLIHNAFVLLPAAHRALGKHKAKLSKSSLHTMITDVNLHFNLRHSPGKKTISSQKQRGWEILSSTVEHCGSAAL